MDGRGMDVDLASNVKSLAMGITQYQYHKSESNLSHVLRHTEVLLGALNMHSSHQLFNSRSVLGSECIASMVKLISDSTTDSHLLSKIVELLNTISKVTDVCSHLQESFSLASVLCLYIVQHCQLEHCSHIMPSALLLLEKVTYARPISSGISHLNQLLTYILQEIEKGESDTGLPCLRVLNNLIVNNMSIQIQTKALMNSKRTKNFMLLLKHGVSQQSILSLSILTCIFWGDDIAKKLYRSQNWFKAMKLIFSTLSGYVNSDALTVAADLCTELLKHGEIAQQLAMYEEENSCSTKLFDHLSEVPRSSSKILQVICAFCHIGLVRSSICQRILKDDMRCWKILLNVARAEKHDLSTSLENSPSLLALDLVKEMCEEVVESANEPMNEWTNYLFATLNIHLSQPFHNDPSQLKFCLLKILKSLQILLCLSSEDDDLLSKVGKNVNCDVLESVLEHQLTQNLTGIVTTQPDWSEIGVDVVLTTLELMLKVKHVVPGLEKVMYKTLQEIRMVPFLVAALSSGKSSKVQCALRLHQEASSLPDFPSVLLGERMAEVNNKRENFNSGIRMHKISVHDASKDLKTVQSNFDRPDAIWNDVHRTNVLDNISVASVSSSSSCEDKENLDSLINKMQGKLQVDKKLSGRTSQIVEMYEQKISSLQTKESHLQDLLDAKALALAQADRVIAQNRCQRIQSEEESRRLAHMLQESEIKCEHLLLEIQRVESNQKDVEKELESTVEENKNLQKIAEQYDSLQAAFNDKKHRIEVQERNLAALSQEYDTLKEMHDMFQKHNEKLKQQMNEGVHRLEELEEERLKLLKDAGDKQMQIHELEGLVMESEKVARQLLDEKSEQEVLIKNLKSNIQNLDEEAKSQKIKLSSLDRTKQQLEHQLKERGNEIKRLHQRNDTQEKKVVSLYSEKETLTQEISTKDDEIKKLHEKLTEQKQTFLKITQLSAALQNSQG
ncbi:protein CIP2A homolog [Styela clava]